MDQPGIEVRPLRQMTGSAEFNEVFFDGARTAKDNVLGPVGEGWKVAMATLGFERGHGVHVVSSSRSRTSSPSCSTTAHKNGAADEPALRDELARALRRPAGHEVQRHADAHEPREAGRVGPEASIGKLFWTTWHQQLRRDGDATCSAPTRLLVAARAGPATTSSTSCTTSSWRAGRRPSTPARARSNTTSSVSACSGLPRENPASRSRTT